MSKKGRLKTRVFELADARSMSLAALAAAMELDKSQVWRVRAGQRGITQIFLEGAKRAFPNVDLGYLFYVEDATEPVTGDEESTPLAS